VAAVAAAQRAVAGHDWPGGAEVRVRMGLHTGEAARSAGGYVGRAVHAAARIRDVDELVLGELASDPLAVLMRPAPLSEAAAASVLRERSARLPRRSAAEPATQP